MVGSGELVRAAESTEYYDDLLGLGRRVFPLNTEVTQVTAVADFFVNDRRVENLAYHLAGSVRPAPIHYLMAAKEILRVMAYYDHLGYPRGSPETDWSRAQDRMAVQIKATDEPVHEMLMVA